VSNFGKSRPDDTSPPLHQVGLYLWISAQNRSSLLGADRIFGMLFLITSLLDSALAGRVAVLEGLVNGHLTGQRSRNVLTDDGTMD
jgi:hypothetical protein